MKRALVLAAVGLSACGNPGEIQRSVTGGPAGDVVIVGGGAAGPTHVDLDGDDPQTPSCIAIYRGEMCSDFADYLPDTCDGGVLNEMITSDVNAEDAPACAAGTCCPFAWEKAYDDCDGYCRRLPNGVSGCCATVAVAACGNKQAGFCNCTFITETATIAAVPGVGCGPTAARPAWPPAAPAGRSTR